MHRMVTSKRRIKRDGGAGGDPFGGGRGHTRMIVSQRVWSSAAHSTILAAVGPAKPTLDGIVGWFGNQSTEDYDYRNRFQVCVT